MHLKGWLISKCDFWAEKVETNGHLSRKGNFLEGTHKIPFHPYLYYFIPKKKNLLNLFHLFISSFTWALVSNYFPIVLLEYFVLRDSIS